MSPVKHILVIGAGELGTQVLLALANHPHSSTTKTSVLLRSSPDPSSEKSSLLNTLPTHNTSIETANVVTSSQHQLTSIFQNYDTIIGCTGFIGGPGLQLKLVKAVLEAKVQRYIPWQFGVDYDIIGRGSAQDLFDEQCDVRDILRAQKTTKWVIISTGMFTSFLFEPSFGVVDFERRKVNALGSLRNRVTLTTPEDIGRLTAEAVLGQRDVFEDDVMFVGGDTVSYEDVAGSLEKHLGKKFERDVLTVEEAKERLKKDPDDAILKYQVVFGQGRGVSWDLERTWGHEIGYHAKTTEEWIKENL